MAKPAMRSWLQPRPGTPISLKGTHEMTDTTYSHQRSSLVVPSLGSLYRSLDGVADLLLRIAVGALLIPHGLQKIGGGFEGTAQFLASVGFVPGGFWAAMLVLVEIGAGIALVLGLLTRPAAFAVLVFMLAAVWFHWSAGFFWTDGGWEYPALWAVAALYFAIRGGGRYSLDRAIGREF
jgi:putative oxidoreductase